MKVNEVLVHKRNISLFDLCYKYGTIFITLGLFLIFSIFVDNFLNVDNVINILRSISIVTIIAIGVTVSLTVGGFDLSVGSTASIANGVCVSLFIWYSIDTLGSIFVALAAGTLVGVINSILISKIKSNDMLITLSTMFIFQGVASTYTKGAVISENMIMKNGDVAAGHITDAFKVIGKVPMIIIIMLVVVAIVHVLLTKTKYGRVMYIIGGNVEAAYLSGINVNKYKTLAYILSAFFASLGGIILASRVQVAEINAGAPYLMDAVAAAYIGFSVFGEGKPNAFGTFVGAVLIGILQNGLIMLSVPYYSMDIIKGLVLAVALIVTYYRKK
ncbi:ABC transporter permease [Clostridium cylindrosporum]|uniref:Ribose transport system permease protein RbsC n=1 Tax=Clostridium cylindrosporum DSM 605 TaxID=1121307 RepID=A0A0J8D9N7_CLOCY|nr:ABC transporter permease [Clostridium cylindrosporum]KMT22557.1 ribose transport system permease protein RbsC [Clostridium cylindrosporum DSM 605]